MDFWQFGIYIVILIGASSLVIMTIILLVRRMNQDKHPRGRQKSHIEGAEWAPAPPVKKPFIPPTPPQPRNADQQESGKEITEPAPVPPQDNLDTVEETLLISPLSAPEIAEAPQIAEHQAAILEPSQTTNTPPMQATSVETEDSNQTNDEADTTEDDLNDPLRIFRTEETQENPFSELSVALPDIDPLDLLREGKEVLKILGSETETDKKWGVT